MSQAKRKSPSASAPTSGTTHTLASRHFRFGWWALVVFACVGIALETLHGFKIGFYLDVRNETRRMLWTLAHAHGVLLSLVNVAFAATVVSGFVDPLRIGLGSTLLVVATILLPGGFFLGGVVLYGGDPGPGIFAVPLGAFALLAALVWIARGIRKDVDA